LTGRQAGSAGGTVTYTVYKGTLFKPVKVANAGTVVVTNGHVPSSNAVTLPPGEYFWMATYSGDTNNAPSHDNPGSELLSVLPVPHCSYGWTTGWSPGCKSVPMPNPKPTKPGSRW
jgi:hypothetical protein